MPENDLRVDWVEIEEAPARAPPASVPPPLRRGRERRVPRRLAVRWTDALHGTFRSWTRDLSAHGMCIRSDWVLSRRTRMDILLLAPSGEAVPLEGVVQWSAAGLMGVRLDRLDRRLMPLLGAQGSRIAPGLFIPESRAGQRERLSRTTETFPARVWIGDRIIEGTTFDLSVRGVGLRTLSAPPQGSGVSLELVLPGRPLVRVEGVVAWVAAPRTCDRMIPAGVLIEEATEEFYRLVLDCQTRATGHAPVRRS